MVSASIRSPRMATNAMPSGCVSVARSAAAGSILTLLAVCPTSVPLGLSKNAWAQQGKTSGVKASAAPLQASANVKLEDENIAAHYANFARVTATPVNATGNFTTPSAQNR